MRHFPAAVLALMCLVAPVLAQSRPKPTYENVRYGPHERNVLDFWQAKSDQPTPVLVSIHGGGFVAGNKSVSPQLLKGCLATGISVAAINYRYSTQAIAPAPFQDGARAVQFLRSKAKTGTLTRSVSLPRVVLPVPVSPCGWVSTRTWPTRKAMTPYCDNPPG